MSQTSHVVVVTYQTYILKKKYEEIENYIKNETDEFSKFCVRLYEEMPKLLDVYKKL